MLGRPYAQLEHPARTVGADLEVAGALLVLGVWAGVFMLAGLLVDSRRDVD